MGKSNAALSAVIFIVVSGAVRTARGQTASPNKTGAHLRDAHGDNVVSPTKPSPQRTIGREWLSASLGAELGARDFQYTDPLTHNLRSYRLAVAPLASLDVGFYPLADTRSWIDIGVVGGYGRAFALESASSSGESVNTTWSRFHAGVRARVRTGGPTFGLTCAYAGEAMLFDSSSMISSELPSVDYRFVHAALDARVPIARFAIFGAAGYDFVLSTGAMDPRFPNANVGGTEVTLGVGFLLSPGFEIRTTASIRRFFYAMNPVPGDEHVAGGATDDLRRVQASLAYVY